MELLVSGNTDDGSDCPDIIFEIYDNGMVAFYDTETNDAVWVTDGIIDEIHNYLVQMRITKGISPENSP